MMFENIGHFFKRMVKPEQKELGSKDAAKERLHLVLMQDRANVSADFLELMKQEIIDVIKKYIVVDESAIDVRLTNQSNDDGTNGAPALYANIPIVNIKNDMMAEKVKEFEGVDFNKEMGLSVPEEKDSQNSETTENDTSIEMQENLEKANLSNESFEEDQRNNNQEIAQISNQDEDKAQTNNQEIEEDKKQISNQYEEVKSQANNQDIDENKMNEQKTDEVNDKEKQEEVIDEYEEEIQKSNIDYVDDDDEDDDDDVTFDDLLKAAEEEEKKNKKD